MIRTLALLSVFLPSSVVAGSVTPLQPIRAGTVLEADLLTVLENEIPGSLTDVRDAVGLEARVNLYPNRAIQPNQLGAPTLVGRNMRVDLIYQSGTLRITVEGRALSRAGAGEIVRVMNTGSRMTVTGIVTESGQVEVVN